MRAPRRVSLRAPSIRLLVDAMQFHGDARKPNFGEPIAGDTRRWRIARAGLLDAPGDAIRLPEERVQELTALLDRLGRFDLGFLGSEAIARQLDATLDPTLDSQDVTIHTSAGATRWTVRRATDATQRPTSAPTASEPLPN